MRYLTALGLLVVTSMFVIAQDVAPVEPEQPAEPSKPVEIPEEKPSDGEKDSVQTENDGAAIVKPSHHITHADIGECSGLQYHDGAWWAHNDSGDGPYLYRSETLDFKEVEKLAVPDAKASDWEELAVWNGNLLACDIGDNRRARSDLKLYEVKYLSEKGNAGKLERVATYPVKYPDGKHDCEAAFSADGKLHLIIKNRGEGAHGIYRFDELKAGELNTPTKIADFNMDVREMATAADYDGETLAVLTYTSVYTTTVEALTAAELTKPKAMQIEAKQCEAIAWKGSTLVYSNEQRDVFTIHDFKKRGFKSALPEHPNAEIPQHAEAEIELKGDGSGWKDKAHDLRLKNLTEGEYFRWAIIGSHVYLAGRINYTGSAFTTSSPNAPRLGAGMIVVFNPKADTFEGESIRQFCIGEDVNQGITCWQLQLGKEFKMLETKAVCVGSTKEKVFQFEVKMPLTMVFAEGKLPSEFYSNVLGRSLHEGNVVHLANDRIQNIMHPYTWSKVTIEPAVETD